MSQVPESIVVTREPIELPVIELLTGRGFITGKSGSGKSNTASVVAEELLEANLPMLIVDTDGEYYGLGERYQLLHATADESGDMQVTPEDAARLADTALDGNVPVVLDLSAYVDPAEGEALVEGVLRELFRLEDTRRKPFLVVVEELHEYLPQQGARSDLGDLLVQIAKRGRKRGLGMCGISQRPASVSKDFITQCDWLVWHRLTWENDTRVVKQLLGAEAAREIQELDDGEAFLMTDWDDRIQRVRFRRKRTLDAGATPSLADVGGPAGQVDDEVLDAIGDVPVSPDAQPAPDGPSPKDDEIRRLRRRIDQLEAELERERAVEVDRPLSGAGGPIAHGLTELGSLAAYAARRVIGGAVAAGQAIERRLRRA
ncbi:MAG: ATP-binding protein [Halobacteriales archaeon]